ncbi:methyltransferase [Lentzea jiangxiensis]|uniref:O-methyltransferase n=1 Tax=Lentzea jiangxiensis TaxID=641025 RepID=A0A1H0SMW6_9PSEU|nr:methyltransferase [Lentzea jiangxiensis]SDP42516.1 O-methyltransferase [Lentzea jiangxiensis]
MSSSVGGVTPEASTVYLISEAHAYLKAAALRAVAQLGVADHLGDEPRPVEELAEATGTNAAFLHRALRLLSTNGIFRQEDDGRFSLTPLGQGLRTDSRYSARWGVVMSTMHTHWSSAFELGHSLRTGQPSFPALFGERYFDHVAGNAEAGAEFHGGMGSFSGAARRLALDEYDFPATGTVVDVGGGTGGFLRDILLENPGLRGVLFDQAHVLPGERPRDVAAERWSEISGDFFVEVPADGDLYVLSYITHDWSDDECVRILRNCRKAMAPGARIAVFDAVVEPGNEPDDAKLLDLVMMMLVTGKERTADEFGRIFDQAGLRLSRIVPADGPLSVVEAVAV